MAQSRSAAGRLLNFTRAACCGRQAGCYSQAGCVQTAPEQQALAMVLAWATACQAAPADLAEVWPLLRWPLLSLSTLQVSEPVLVQAGCNRRRV